jgi:hypothetical protein
MVVRSANQTWLLDTPIDRRELLQPLLTAVVLLGAAAGSSIAAVLGYVGALPPTQRVEDGDEHLPAQSHARIASAKGGIDSVTVIGFPRRKLRSPRCEAGAVIEARCSR